MDRNIYKNLRVNPLDLPGYLDRTFRDKVVRGFLYWKLISRRGKKRRSSDFVVSTSTDPDAIEMFFFFLAESFSDPVPS